MKCGNHNDGCAWTGSIGGYASHMEQCVSARSNQAGSALREELKALKQNNAQLEKKNAQLKKLLQKRPNLPILFQGEYNYRRENVVELSQLISRYLEKKPAEINANQIFNCVRSLYMDLEKKFTDNPEHYQIDMKMLLATCEASNWFSARQYENIRNWYQEQF